MRTDPQRNVFTTVAAIMAAHTVTAHETVRRPVRPVSVCLGRQLVLRTVWRRPPTRNRLEASRTVWRRSPSRNRLEASRLPQFQNAVFGVCADEVVVGVVAHSDHVLLVHLKIPTSGHVTTLGSPTHHPYPTGSSHRRHSRIGHQFAACPRPVGDDNNSVTIIMG